MRPFVDVWYDHAEAVRAFGNGLAKALRIDKLLDWMLLWWPR